MIYGKRRLELSLRENTGFGYVGFRVRWVSGTLGLDNVDQNTERGGMRLIVTTITSNSIQVTTYYFTDAC